MKGLYFSLLFTFALLGSIIAPPAPRLSEIRITRCDCTSCTFKQRGYSSVSVFFSGSLVRCTRTRILEGRTIVGWYHNCPISRRSGKFEVRSGTNNLCGVGYDHVYLNNCRGTPCSALSG